MLFRVSIEIPDSYDLTEQNIQAILSNSLWFYAKSLDDEADQPTKTFNSDVKVFVGKIHAGT